MLGLTYKLGTPIFCEPPSWGCSITPGYEAVAQNSEDCWTGHQLICQFNVNAWRQTKTYAKLQQEMGPNAIKTIPKFEWLGSSPECNSSPADCLKAGLLPLTSSNFGNGDQCSSGLKWLGMSPLLEEQKEIVAIGATKCIENSPEKEAYIQKAISIGQDFVKDMAAALIKYGNVSVNTAKAPILNITEGYRNSSFGSTTTTLIIVLSILIFVGIIGFILWKRYYPLNLTSFHS